MNSVYDFVVRKGVLRKYRGTEIDVVIPDGVEVIGQYAFRECPRLRSVVMPDSVTRIDQRAFCQAEELVHVTISPNVTQIGKMAFEDCIRLDGVVLPKSLTTIGTCAFSRCRSLTGITIPAGVTTLDWWVFSGCRSLTHVTLEDGVVCPVEEFEQIFPVEGLHVLTAPSLRLEGLPTACKPAAAVGYLSDPDRYRDPERIPPYHRYVVSKKKAILTIVFGLDLVPALQQLMTIAKVNADNFEPDFLVPAMTAEAQQCVAFLMDWKQKHISPEDVDRKLRRELNRDPYNVEQMRKCWRYKVLPDGSVSIHGCKGQQTHIALPPRIGNKPVTALGDHLFDGAQSGSVSAISERIQAVSIPDSVTAIGSYTFHGCGGLTSLVLPSGVTVIGECAFSLCIQLADLTMPEELQVIGDLAFCQCNSLTALVLPPKVHTIGEYAFAGCDRLRELTLPASLTCIGAEAFRDCPLLKLRVPRGSYAEAYAQGNHIPFCTDDPAMP